jgi:2-C-methyl-D-erythritol 4-phosphate cytidylyltransferase
MPHFAVILPAAGQSSRFREREKKPFATLDGRAVWLRTAEQFITRDDVCQCLVVVAPDDMETFRHRFEANLAFLNIRVVAGGKERFESVANALAHVSAEAELVAIHDAVRPCITRELIDQVFASAARSGAALLAVPVTDTVKRANAQGQVEATVARQGLWLAQTPQVFRRDWLVDAYGRREALGQDVTDDAQLIEAAGHSVYLVAGSSSNLKITTREDLGLAQAILQSRPKPRAARPIHPFADEAQW